MYDDPTLDDPIQTDQPVKYPGIVVPLSGEDGNGFFIVGRVSQALKRGGVSRAEVDTFTREAMSGDYDHLLQTCLRWVTVT